MSRSEWAMRRKLIRFALWNLVIRVCGVVGPPIDRFAVWFERKTGRESWLYGCRIHDFSPGIDIPEAWWHRFGWGDPKEP